MRYNINNLFWAKYIMSVQFEIDRFGLPMVGQDAIDWAMSVLKYFNSVWDYARKCVGAWSCRLKLAWQWAKSGFKSEKDEEIRHSITYKILSKRFSKISVMYGTIRILDGDYHSMGRNDFKNYKLPD